LKRSPITDRTLRQAVKDGLRKLSGPPLTLRRAAVLAELEAAVAKEWAVLNCPHCLTKATAAITLDAAAAATRMSGACPGCKKHYKSSANIKQLVASRHPSPAEALEALEMLG
jgi:hypothetical protein